MSKLIWCVEDPMKQLDDSGWGSLPEDLLSLILNKLSNSVYDYVRCATVCKSWYWVAQLEANRRNIKQQLPLLLIPTADGSRTHRTLYNMIDDTKLSCPLAVPYSKRCCGSSHGWLIFCEETLALTLFNPFSGATIHLPPLMNEEQIDAFLKSDHTVYSEYEIKKVILSGDPSLDDHYQVLALQFEGRVALYTDARCIYPKNYFNLDFGYFSPENDDIIYFNRKFYCVVGMSFVSFEVVCQEEAYLRMERVKGLDIQDTMSVWSRGYLAESITGTLLYIERFIIGCFHPYCGDDEYIEEDEDDDYAFDVMKGYFEIDNKIYEYRRDDYNLTWCFRVFELVEEESDDEKKKEFVELGNLMKQGQRGLGDQALFLGFNHSVAVRASDFPGCKPNSIYYTDDNCLGEPYQKLGPIDLGVYTFGDQVTKPLYMLDTSHTHLPPPIWIQLPHPKFTTEFVR